MAIAKALPKLKVEVFVKDAPLEEHVDDDDQNADNEVTKFIEASSGDNFEVKYRFSPGFSIRHAMLIELDIDGEYADSAVFNPGTSIRWNSTYAFKGSREFDDGGYFVRKFYDGDTRKFEDSLKKKLHSVGVISVRFYWVTASGSSTPKAKAQKNETLGVVPEKALKAALKSLLIIPRTPSPVPLEERDINTLTLEESRELLRLQREQMDAAPVIKREGIKRERSSTIINEDNDDDEVTFLSAKRRRLPVTLDENGAEIIDLT
ncbi:hypothetical protein J4E80_007894 [Alternaria sp. BMP 0032]|nr:hypothetical protein J4E80_007894 [Alternaria sp. BMP 0032]